MPNHFDSVLIAFGSKEDIDKFVDDFEKSSICGERLCLCQLVDPIPIILYKCKYLQMNSLEGQEHVEGRPFTEEEKQELNNFGYYALSSYALKWWGLKYGCYDGVLRRVQPNIAVYTFWTPLNELGERILWLLHSKYPNIVFKYEGQDECNPHNHFSTIIDQSYPCWSKEEIDERWITQREQERKEWMDAIMNQWKKYHGIHDD